MSNPPPFLLRAGLKQGRICLDIYAQMSPDRPLERGNRRSCQDLKETGDLQIVPLAPLQGRVQVYVVRHAEGTCEPPGGTTPISPMGWGPLDPEDTLGASTFNFLTPRGVPGLFSFFRRDSRASPVRGGSLFFGRLGQQKSTTLTPGGQKIHGRAQAADEETRAIRAIVRAAP